MALSRPSRTTTLLMLIAVCMLILNIVVFWPFSTNGSMNFTVPDGSPEEILRFVRRLEKRKPKFFSQEDQISYIKNVNRALFTAGDKILAQKPAEKYLGTAVELKLGALTMLAANDIDNSADEAMELVQEYKADKRPAVSKMAENFWTPIRVINSPKLNAEERENLIEELVATVGKTKFSEQAIGNVINLGSVLLKTGHPDDAGKIYDSLAKVASESNDPKIRPNAERFLAMGRYLRLPGGKMHLEGKLLTGEMLDWESYRGKVVLVDYWATWCGPCLQELPNVKANYKKYHSKGFEVVAVNLDESRKAVERFVAQEKLPWPQLFDEKSGVTWSHPMALYYAINSVPTAILVGKDGKVVSMHAQGPELSKQLEKLLGKGS